MSLLNKIRKFLNHKYYKHWEKQYSKESAKFSKELKNRIKKRDNYQCQECGVKARQLRQMHSYLTIHHINFNHNDNKEDNLITLCPLCHAKTNFTKETWIKYFLEKRELRNDNSV
jgi:5-methylcytosine-specific restriction endonuclease McrA